MNALKVFATLLVFLIAALVVSITGNLLVGLMVIPATSFLLQFFTGLRLLDSTGLTLATLAAIPRTAQQQVNPGGGRRLFIIPTDNFTGEWPKRSDITSGEITVAPPLITGTPSPTFVEVAISDNSLKLDESLKGASGYQSWEQMLELKVAGYSKEQVAAFEKVLNTEVVAIIVLTDGQRVVCGTSLMGLQFEVTHTTGAKGGDRREWTLKAKNDGYQFGYVPLASTVTIPGVTA